MKHFINIFITIWVILLRLKIIILYNLYKLLFFFFKKEYIKKLVLILWTISSFIIIIFNFIKNDYKRLKKHYILKKKNYFKFSIFRHILIIIMSIFGIVPMILFIYCVFFGFRTIFKYIFITLDFFVFYNYNHNYDYIKSNIIFFFDYIPRSLIKLNLFLFKSNWTLFFLKKFKEYLERKKYKILKYIFAKTDYFFLIYIPKQIVEIQDTSFSQYLKSMLWYIRLKKRIKKICRRIIRKFLKILSKKVRNWKKILKTFLKFKNKKYYYYYFKYKRIIVYLIWIRKFVFSEVCWVTIYAFFKISYLNIKAIFIYSFIFVYHVIFDKIICKICYFHIKISGLKWSLHILIKQKKQDIIMFSNNKWQSFLNLIIAFYNYIFIWIRPIILWPSYVWINLKGDNHHLEFGVRSEMYWNLKIYSVVVKFFGRLYPTTLFFYDLKFTKIIYYLACEYVYLRLVQRWEEFKVYIKMVILGGRAAGN